MLLKATLGEKIAKVKATRSGRVQEDCEKVKAAISDHVRSLRRGAREVCEKRQKLPEAILCEKHTKGYARRLKKGESRHKQLGARGLRRGMLHLRRTA